MYSMILCHQSVDFIWRVYSCEKAVERLTVELEHKTAMLMEVKTSLREAVEREKQIKKLSGDTEVSLLN